MANFVLRQQRSHCQGIARNCGTVQKSGLCFFHSPLYEILSNSINFFYRIFGFINVLELVNQTLGMNCHYARPPYKSPSLGDSFSLHDDTVILHESRPHVIKDQGSSEIRVIAAAVPVGMHKRTQKLRNCFSMVGIKPRDLCMLDIHCTTGAWSPAGS